MQRSQSRYIHVIMLMSSLQDLSFSIGGSSPRQAGGMVSRGRRVTDYQRTRPLTEYFSNGVFTFVLIFRCMVSVAFCTDDAVRRAVETAPWVPARGASQHKSDDDVGVVDGGEDKEAAAMKLTRVRSHQTFRRESDRLFNVRLSHSPFNFPALRKCRSRHLWHKKGSSFITISGGAKNNVWFLRRNTGENEIHRPATPDIFSRYNFTVLSSFNSHIYIHTQPLPRTVCLGTTPTVRHVSLTLDWTLTP